jgi:hypothetical protein
VSQSAGHLVKNAVCQFCQRPVLLELGASHITPAWRMYDCPHCGKTNFAMLPAQVVAARSAGE